jgi:hypothetical protein
MSYPDAPNASSDDPAWDNGDEPEDAPASPNGSSEDRVWDNEDELDDAPDSDEAEVVEPPAPRTLEDTGLSPSFVTELVLKIMHYAELPTAEHIARTVALPARLLDGMLASLREGQLCETIGAADLLPGKYRYRLTDLGRRRAEEALARCRYAGPAPVPLDQYEEMAEKQARGQWRPAKEAIRKGIASLILEDDIANFVERALYSGRCAMIFGPTGNGKTHLLASFIHNLDGSILIPYSVYAYGQIIKVFDSFVHIRVSDGEAENGSSNGDEENGAALLSQVRAKDKRWVRIRRPGVIVAGELTLDHLELGFDPVSRFYQAPPHLKAQGGILVVDDFGRQKVPPRELLNRWIMSLERGRDNLTLQTGESINLPFHLVLLLSTNLAPAALTDEALLRRIPYKVYIPPPVPGQFKEILRGQCQAWGVECSEQALNDAVAFIFSMPDIRPSGSLARDMASIIVDNSAHDGCTPVLTREALDLALQQFTARQWAEALGVTGAPSRDG